MSKICQVTGKKPVRGNTYVTRGIAKKKKGIGLKVTGKTKRRFQPNLAKKRIWVAEENRFVTMRVSASGLRTMAKKGAMKVISGLRKQGQKI